MRSFRQRRLTWCLLLALLCGGWTVVLLVVPGLVLDTLGEGGYLIGLLAAVPAFVVALVWSVVHLLRGLALGRRYPALPLTVNLVTLSIFLLGPVVGVLDLIDFQIHASARMEVVRQVASGALLPASPLIQVAPLPRGFSRGVSDGGGQRSIGVFQDPDRGILHVAFFPPRGLRLVSSTFLYCLKGCPPEVPNRFMPNALRAEPLGDGWYRVLYGPAWSDLVTAPAIERRGVAPTGASGTPGAAYPEEQEQESFTGRGR